MNAFNEKPPLPVGYLRREGELGIFRREGNTLLKVCDFDIWPVAGTFNESGIVGILFKGNWLGYRGVNEEDVFIPYSILKKNRKKTLMLLLDKHLHVMAGEVKEFYKFLKLYIEEFAKWSYEKGNSL